MNTTIRLALASLTFGGAAASAQAAVSLPLPAAPHTMLTRAEVQAEAEVQHPATEGAFGFIAWQAMPAHDSAMTRAEVRHEAMLGADMPRAMHRIDYVGG